MTKTLSSSSVKQISSPTFLKYVGLAPFSVIDSFRTF